MSQPWRRLMSYRRAAVEILIVSAVLSLLGLAVWGLNFWLTDLARDKTSATEIGRVRDVVGIVQGFVWAFLIVAGGVFAYRKLQLFRDFEPHLTITHEVTHRGIGTQYLHISVTATLRNNSKVQVNVQRGYITLRQISPIDDEDVVQKYAQIFAESDTDDVMDFQWEELDTVVRASNDNPLVIEPSEYHTELGEFVVSDAVKTVLVYSYFYNPQYSGSGRSAHGWTASTVYDIVVEK